MRHADNVDLSRLSPSARARILGLPPQDDGSGDEFRRGALDREAGLPKDENGSISYRRGYDSTVKVIPERKVDGMALLAEEIERNRKPRVTREEQLRNLYGLLKQAAMESIPCPTNEWLAHSLGYSSYGAVVPMLRELCEMDLIKVHSDGGNTRRVEIVDLGICTAPHNRKLREQMLSGA